MAAPTAESFHGSPLQKNLICARSVARNLLTWLRSSVRLFGAQSGSTHLGRSVDESVEYIRRVLDDYFQYGSVSEENLQGKRILEIGPGDSVGVALLLVAAGAEQVVGIDAFDSGRDEEHHRRVVRALRGTLPVQRQVRFDEACDAATGAVNPERVLSLTGAPLEKAEAVLGEAGFDWIVSRAVLEETRDAPNSICIMDRLLRPGGVMTHKIDLRDYGLFSGRGFHPLEMYTIPQWLYPLMSNHSWIPNRQPLSAYTEPLRSLGYEIGLRYTHLTGSDQELLPHPAEIPQGPEAERSRRLAAQIRPRLAKPYRNAPEEDLLVAGVFVDARKPG